MSRAAKAALWILAPWLGRDGKPSRTMLVITIVLGSYLLSRPVPEMIGIVAILATFGIKPLMAWVERSSATVTAASQVTLERRTIKTEAHGEAQSAASHTKEEGV